MARYTQLQTTQITNALKRANQRIVQLGKTYKQGSSIYKQEVGKFQKGAYKDFVTYSKSGNIKFDIRSIMKLIRSEGNTPKVNRMISEIAGIKFDAEGNIKEIKGAGVPTVTEVDKRITKRLERLGEDWTRMSKKEIREAGEEMYEFSESFQTTYNTYMANYGEPEARKDNIISLMYSDLRGKKGRLTYPQLKEIKAKMEDMITEARGKALIFEEENTDEL